MNLQYTDVYKVITLAGLTNEFNAECFITENGTQQVDLEKVNVFFDRYNLPKEIEAIEASVRIEFKSLIANKQDFKKGEVYVFSSDRIMGTSDFVQMADKHLYMVEFLEDTYLEKSFTVNAIEDNPFEKALLPLVENHLIKLTKVNGAVAFQSLPFIPT